MNTSDIQEHMDVVGSDGQHVGTVDHLDGERIKLTKSDPTSGGEHHFIPVDWVENIEGETVKLTRSSAQARQEWQSA